MKYGLKRNTYQYSSNLRQNILSNVRRFNLCKTSTNHVAIATPCLMTQKHELKRQENKKTSYNYF